MIQNNIWNLSLLIGFNKRIMNKIEHYNIGAWIGQTGMTNNPLHSTDLFFWSKTVRIIINSSFYKKQIDLSFV